MTIHIFEGSLARTPELIDLKMALEESRAAGDAFQTVFRDSRYVFVQWALFRTFPMVYVILFQINRESIILFLFI